MSAYVLLARNPAPPGPVEVAIGNTVARPLGARPYRLPLTRKRIMDALLSVG
jgi:hypothetical protein